MKKPRAARMAFPCRRTMHNAPAGRLLPAHQRETPGRLWAVRRQPHALGTRRAAPVIWRGREVQRPARAPVDLRANQQGSGVGPADDARQLKRVLGRCRRRCRSVRDQQSDAGSYRRNALVIHRCASCKQRLGRKGCRRGWKRGLARSTVPPACAPDPPLGSAACGSERLRQRPLFYID